MDEKKVIKIETTIDTKKEVPNKNKASSFSLHSNPIIQKVFLSSANEKKDKFKFKDLFR